MLYIFMFSMGFLAGGICIFLLLESKRRFLKVHKSWYLRQSNEIRCEKDKIHEHYQLIDSSRRELEHRKANQAKKEASFKSKYITYNELKNENSTLKHDLQNIDVSLRKLQLDQDIQQQKQTQLDSRAKELGDKYLKDNIKWLSRTLTQNNYAASKKSLVATISRCRKAGLEISTKDENMYIADMKSEYEKVVRAAFEREEQARIKALIREEQKREKEIEQELNRLERERAAIQAALDKAMLESNVDEINQLRARLAEAEEKSQRVLSQAQLTKAGHVYVISNIGSFGEGIYKIGMTRRLEPDIRVRELSGASVPFKYDIHMMISCEDAPSLENALHKSFHKTRLNKVNPRKEFFRADIESIRKIVEQVHGKVEYVADPEALEYRQSESMSDDDSEFIDAVYDSVNDEESLQME